MSSFFVPASHYAPPSSAETPGTLHGPELTREQARAVQADVHALAVWAGAGTGKTHTLAARVRHLARERGVAEHRILVVTFTRDATESLRRRISRHLGRDHDVEVRSFHSFAARSLPGADRRFVGVKGARPLMREAMRRAFARDPRGPVLERILRAGALDADQGAEEKLLAFWSYCKNGEMVPREAVAKQFTVYRGFEDLLTEATVEYEALKSGVLDFDDVLLRFRDRLRSDPAFLAEVAGGFDHVLVDEYQDVNGVQHETVRLLTVPVPRRHRPRVTVVGDARQAIYGFRGGNPAYLSTFLDAYPPRRGRRLHLSRNFRSSPRLLRFANRLLPEGGTALRAPPGTPPGVAPRVEALPDGEAEAQFVCNSVEDLLARGEDPAEVAILARARHLLRRVDEAVTERVHRAARFAKRKGLALEAAEWVLAFARAVDPAEPDAPSLAGAAAGDVAEARRRLRAAFARKDYPALDVLREARTLAEGEARLGDAIAEVVRRVAREVPDSRDGFRTAVSGALGPDLVTEALARIPRQTIHAAKGLEWDHVFVVGVHDGGLPGDPALAAEDGPARDALVGEEKRLLYVACTRSRRTLTLTYPEGKGKRSLKPSRFLADFTG